MAVEYREHWGINLATGVNQQHAQDLIYVDGTVVGLLGYQAGASVVLMRDVSEADRATIHKIACEKKQRPVKIAGPPKPIPIDCDKDEEEEEDG